MHDLLAEEKPLPEHTAYIWDYFCELHHERATGGMGPGRITATTIKDWCYITRTQLDL